MQVLDRDPIRGDDLPATWQEAGSPRWNSRFFFSRSSSSNPLSSPFENILKWRERDKDQEQVFIDQAMRVPKLLLGGRIDRHA